ncbi:MAG TPA: methyltransferase domain-containing protein [Candidatus Hydrogenedentes bacterium]|nr:methyltransferase domain-containing protein [Candidatus Hydrogenedentota bacterium]
MNAHSCHNRNIPQDWYATSFGALYPILYAHRTIEAAAQECTFALQQTNLSPDTHCIDLCCGNGRHLVHLARHTPWASGIDYSTELLRIARTTLANRARLIRADLRALPFQEKFDVAFSFFTSFGYFQTEEENLTAARNMVHTLKPGGKLFMDSFNPIYLEQHLLPHSERVQQGCRITEDRWIDSQTRRINKITTVHQDNTLTAQVGESVRMYALDELSEMFARTGLEIDRVFGDYGGQAFGDTQPRMILLGHRTK